MNVPVKYIRFFCRLGNNFAWFTLAFENREIFELGSLAGQSATLVVGCDAIKTERISATSREGKIR